PLPDALPIYQPRRLHLPRSALPPATDRDRRSGSGDGAVPAAPAEARAAHRGRTGLDRLLRDHRLPEGGTDPGRERRDRGRRARQPRDEAGRAAGLPCRHAFEQPGPDRELDMRPEQGRATPAAIEVAGADVSLGGPPVLHAVALRAESGELLALFGAKGSGKSTLLRVAVGLYTPQAGTARLWGTPAHRPQAHDRLGYVPQDTSDAGSIPTTARETVATGLLGTRRWLLRRRDPRVMRALTQV